MPAAGSTGQAVEFNKKGDAKGRYTIYQFQRINATNRYSYVPIGSWTDRSIQSSSRCCRSPYWSQAAKLTKFQLTHCQKNST